jgi:hypothetical protein
MICKSFYSQVFQRNVKNNFAIYVKEIQSLDNLYDLHYVIVCAKSIQLIYIIRFNYNYLLYSYY